MLSVPLLHESWVVGAVVELTGNPDWASFATRAVDVRQVGEYTGKQERSPVGRERVGEKVTG